MSGPVNVEVEDIINHMREIEPEEFEELIANLWEHLGYKTELTQSSADRGIDVTATREFPYEEQILIQAKRYSSTLSGPEVREYGVLTKRDGVDSVIVISTSGFTSQAKQEAERYNTKLIDGPTLAQLLIEKDAVDLIRELTGEIESANINPKRPSTQSTSTEQEVQANTGEGEFLTIEVVGYDHKNIDFMKTNSSGVYYNSKECTVLCFYIRNKSNSDWKFRPTEALSIISKDGFSHNRAIGCPNSSEKNKLSPWNNGRLYTITRDSKSRICLFYNSKFIPQKIAYEEQLMFCHGDIGGNHNRSSDREKITVYINDDDRDRINTLPDSLSTDSVALSS